MTKRNFSVSVIPHTGEETTLLKKKAGDPVNLENDIVGKYIQKFVDIGRNSGADRGKMPDGDNAAGNAKGTPGSAWSFFRNMDFKTDALKIFRNIQKI